MSEAKAVGTTEQSRIGQGLCNRGEHPSESARSFPKTIFGVFVMNITWLEDKLYWPKGNPLLRGEQNPPTTCDVMLTAVYEPKLPPPRRFMFLLPLAVGVVGGAVLTGLLAWRFWL